MAKKAATKTATKTTTKSKKPNQFEHVVSASIDRLSKNYESFMNTL